MQGDRAPGKVVDSTRSEKVAPARSPVDNSNDQPLAEQGLARPGSLSPERILSLQRTVGNRAVQRFLTRQSGPATAAREMPPSVHSIASSIAPSRPLAIAPAIQRFSADPHEQISAAGLRGRGYTAEQMADIQLGNWATDMNQISLVVPHLQTYLGFNLTAQEQFQVVQLLAVGKFGEQAASRMSQGRLGQYEAAEHFDNPAGPNAPREQAAVASHIASGIGNIESNLRRALDAGPTPAGRQHYGRALHTMEDYFAHTNFVQIAMRVADASQPEPYGGAVESTGERGVQYQLTSGIFVMADTAMSILHLLIAEVTKPAEPGRITSGDRITQMIVNHVSPTLGRAFAGFLRARTAVSSAASRASSTLGRIAEAASPPLWVYNRARELARRALEAGVNAAMREVGQRVTGTGSQPSHTRMNVDDPASGGRLYPIARDLAQYAVTRVDPLMQAAWGAAAGQPRDEARQRLFAEVRRLLVHPERDPNGWWRSIVSRGIRSR